jgi:hypothetical protein
MINPTICEGPPSTIARLAVQARISLPLMFSDAVVALPQIRTGKLRALGLSSAARLPSAPEILPLAELGVPGFDTAGWGMVVAPAGTPASIVTRLYNDLSGGVCRAGAAEADRMPKKTLHNARFRRSLNCGTDSKAPSGPSASRRAVVCDCVPLMTPRRKVRVRVAIAAISKFVRPGARRNRGRMRRGRDRHAAARGRQDKLAIKGRRRAEGPA